VPITASDIKFRLSIKTGSAGNSLAQADPNASLGKYISTTDLVDGALNVLFDDVGGDENAAGTVDYRCVFIYNAHGSLTFLTPRVWVSGIRFTGAGSTDTFTSNSHGLANGEVVRVEAELPADALPGGMSNSTTYYVVGAATNTFQLSTSSGGSPVDLTADGSGAVRRYGNTTVALAVDNVAASAVGSASAQADQVANETTAPSAVGAFSSPTTKSTGLSLGSLAAGECRAVWVRRTALNNGARNTDSFTLGVSGDTAA
jgi:hypothetical protein